MNYQETLNYLFSRLPMYQRIGAAAYKANLDNTHALMDILKHPEKGFRSVHVAGTNGKGSVCHMLASIFQEAGYKTGLYTSPHLIDFRERIKINGQMIAETEVVNFVQKYDTEFSTIQPSFFEWTMALAFDNFRNRAVDIAIIETGLGGRLDSTNVITPEISVITNIGYDHMQFLGNTLASIATEKAGIIKPSIPVVIGEKKEETAQIFKQRAAESESEIYFSDEMAVHPTFNTDLKGEHQQKNRLLVQCTMKILTTRGFDISDSSVEAGLKHVVKNTGLMGRWQILSEHPNIICDVGHNAEGIRYILQEIDKLKFDNLHLVWSMVNDKNIEAVLTLLPTQAHYYFTNSSVPRSLDGHVLKAKANSHGLIGNAYEDPQEALLAAQKAATTEDLIFIGGSTFLIGDILKSRSKS